MVLELLVGRFLGSSSRRGGDRYRAFRGYRIAVSSRGGRRGRGSGRGRGRGRRVVATAWFRALGSRSRRSRRSTFRFRFRGGGGRTSRADVVGLIVRDSVGEAVAETMAAAQEDGAALGTSLEGVAESVFAARLLALVALGRRRRSLSFRLIVGVRGGVAGTLDRLGRRR